MSHSNNRGTIGRTSFVGCPLLRRIPSTRATVCFEHLESISPAEREELLDVRARVTALGFVLTPAARLEIQHVVNSNPALVNISMRGRGDRWPWAFAIRASGWLKRC